MMFCDYGKIFIASGSGGKGCVSFRREKNIPFGGPDGGNGGKGGDVFFQGDGHLGTLIDFRYKTHYRAQKGQDGMGRLKAGKYGEDLVLRVPLGTQIWFEDHCVGDILQEGERLLVAKGGWGGRGNATFVTSENRAPRDFTPGGPAQERTLILKLKLLAHWGIIGLPNAGKSTFLRALTRSQSKIGPYPFTTLVPQLGVYIDQENRHWVLADLPGLIEGAHQGKGLGHRFLAHGERCGGIFHLIDGSAEDPLKDYQIVREELLAYNPQFATKKEIVLFTKMDLLMFEEKESFQEKVMSFFQNQNQNSQPLFVDFISAEEGENLDKERIEKWISQGSFDFEKEQETPLDLSYKGFFFGEEDTSEQEEDNEDGKGEEDEEEDEEDGEEEFFEKEKKNYLKK